MEIFNPQNVAKFSLKGDGPFNKETFLSMVIRKKLVNGFFETEYRRVSERESIIIDSSGAANLVIGLSLFGQDNFDESKTIQGKRISLELKYPVTDFGDGTLIKSKTAI